MIYDHFSLVPKSIWRWPNFSFRGDPRLACSCCGEFYLDPDSMDMLQLTREIIGKPIRLNSGHRCAIHNARVGGAPLSQHKKIAFDIQIAGHIRSDLLTALIQAGFGSFGFYQTFIHADKRPGRRWFGKGGRELWIGDLY